MGGAAQADLGHDDAARRVGHARMIAGPKRLRTRMLLAFGALVALVLALMLASGRALDGAQRAEAERLRSQQVLLALQQFAVVIDSDRGLPLCALTGDGSYLPRRNIAARVSEAREALQALLRDDAPQRASLEALDRWVAEWRAQFVQPLVQACASADARLSAAAVSEIGQQGQALRQRIRGGLDEMRELEQRRLGEHQAQQVAAAAHRERLTGVLAAAIVLLSVLTLFGLAQSTGRLDRRNEDLQREVIERTQAEQFARAAQRRLGLLIDHIPDGVIVFDATGRIERVNASVETIFKRPANSVLGHPVAELIPQLEDELTWSPTDAPDPSGTPRLRVRRENLRGLRGGEHFPLEIALVEIQADNQRGGLCVCRDLGESLRVERMKRDFVTMVSHELRTPLTSIHGSLALLADGSAGELPRSVARLVRLAHDNSLRLAALVNDILDYEKLQAGVFYVDLGAHDLGDIARRVADEAEGYGATFEVPVLASGAPGPLPVWADPLRLAQVITNLIANAIKFTPPGRQVRVWWSAVGGRAHLEVHDDGPGVPPDFVESLFEPFAQADELATRKHGGTGLGLAISKQLIERMGGTIGLVPPEPGQGATFWIELPLHRAG
jgi:NtrC-family two-component system sensor histidine kinase KinB